MISALFYFPSNDFCIVFEGGGCAAVGVGRRATDLAFDELATDRGRGRATDLGTNDVSNDCCIVLFPEQ